MTLPGVDPGLLVAPQTSVPDGWDQLLQRVPDAEFATDPRWHQIAARHYPGGRAWWLTARSPGGELLGGLPLLARRRWRLDRLESSFDGTVAGPLVAADLAPARQDAVLAALCSALLGRLGGRTMLVAVTVAAPQACRSLADLAGRGPWQQAPFVSAVVDCTGGADAVASRAWSNNRRNERNRGLKRGCTVQAERGPGFLDDWYPLYARQASQWRQALVPRGFLLDVMAAFGDRVVINTVRLDGRLLGAHVCLVARRRLIPFLSAADPAFYATHFPHTLLYWQDIVHACDHGLQAVDFGGCAGRDTLWDFKRRCGGVPEARLQLQALSPLGRALRAATAWRHRGAEADA